MSYSLPQKISQLAPYEPNPDIYKIKLDANESFIQPSPKIRSEIERIARKFDFVRYPDPMATEVSAAFCDFYGVGEQYVTAGSGSDELISTIMNTLLNRGDKVMMFTPDFSMYSIYCGIAELQRVVVPKEDDFSLNIDAAIEKANKENVNAVILSNPCNPTGQGIERDDMRRFIRSVDALFILDEAYMDFWDQSLVRETADYDNLIVLRTCSKAVGIASLRLGFAVSNAVITNALHAAKSPYNVNGMTQAIGAAILSDKTYASESIKKIKKSILQLFNGLKELEDAHQNELTVYRTCTNFVYVKMKNAQQMFDELLKRDICIRAFGGGYLRITCGTPEQNTSLLHAMKEIIEKRG